jgi:hypothetical protein
MKRALVAWVVLLVGLAAVSSGDAVAARVGHAEGFLASHAADATQTMCGKAKRLGYVPKQDVCSDALTADIDGDGRPDLVLLYARPITGAGASLKAYPETLKVVRAEGGTIQARLKPTTPAPGLIAVDNVNGRRGDALFVATNWTSSGPEVLIYSFLAGNLVDSGATLNVGGDSADRFGINCMRTPRPEIIQHDYSLIGPNIYGRWRLTTYTYIWSGATLRRIGRATAIHHGWPGRSAIGLGAGCGPLSGSR